MHAAVMSMILITACTGNIDGVIPLDAAMPMAQEGVFRG